MGPLSCAGALELCGRCVRIATEGQAVTVVWAAAPPQRCGGSSHQGGGGGGGYFASGDVQGCRHDLMDMWTHIRVVVRSLMLARPAAYCGPHCGEEGGHDRGVRADAAAGGERGAAGARAGEHDA